MSTQRVRVWVAGLTIGGAVNKAQNSTVSAFLYAVSGTSDLLVVPSQYFYYFESRARPPSVLRDILKGEPRHWRYAESAFLPEPVQRFYYSAGNEKMQRYSSFFMASMR